MKFNLPSALIGAAFILGIFVTTAFQGTITPTYFGLTPQQRAVLDTLSVEYISDCVGGPGYKTLRVNSANLQVVNGAGSTSTTNGLGNMLVGYNEAPSFCEGSHNLILGMNNGYTSYGSIVTGESNVSDANHNVIFGSANYVFSNLSTILGGSNNTIQTNPGSAIVGGESNIANGRRSVILGGEGNVTHNSHCCITGGVFNSNFGDKAVIVGGRGNVVSSTASYSVVGGGNTRSTTGVDDWVAGNLFEDN